MVLKPFFTITPIDTPGRSAVSYVPFVILSRGLAFLRMLYVGKILGEIGQPQFGIYQPGLELINWLVPLVMFGLADVAERYASKFARENQLSGMVKKHIGRLLTVGVCVALTMIAAAPWIANVVWGKMFLRSEKISLIALCAVTIVLLALYQYIAAILRGLRAYSGSAGLEVSSAILLFVLSLLAAMHGTAVALLGAYALSLLLPLAFYFVILIRYLRQFHPSAGDAAAANSSVVGPVVLDYETIPGDVTHLSRFARWTLLRLLLVMTFGFLAVWSVGYLVNSAPHFLPYDFTTPQRETANFSMPYRIAQLLAYLSVTLWASSYGIASAAWSQGQIRRAKVQLFRIGKFGAVLMSLAGVVLLLTRGVFATRLPAYSAAIAEFLPPMLALFFWYGLLAFSSVYTDLQEKPQLGALLWASAICIQLVLILIPMPQLDAKDHVLLACCVGVSFALFILAPVILWHPFRMSATVVPLVVVAVSAVSLFSPGYVVDYIAPPVMVGAVVFLYMSGLLVRPIDRRAWRKYRENFGRKV